MKDRREFDESGKCILCYQGCTNVVLDSTSRKKKKKHRMAIYLQVVLLLF